MRITRSAGTKNSGKRSPQSRGIVRSRRVRGENQTQQDQRVSGLRNSRKLRDSGLIFIPLEIAEFCKRWKIGELALFGSILHEGFRPDSDVDFLVSFIPDADWGLLDHMRMQQELESILHRKVDLVSKRAVEGSRNHVRKNEILGMVEILFSEQGMTHAAR